jgi:hypothetical protein
LNSTITVAAKVVVKLNLWYENSDTNKGRHTTDKSKIRIVLKEKHGKAKIY